MLNRRPVQVLLVALTTLALTATSRVRDPVPCQAAAPAALTLREEGTCGWSALDLSFDGGCGAQEGTVSGSVSSRAVLTLDSLGGVQTFSFLESKPDGGDRACRAIANDAGFAIDCERCNDDGGCLDTCAGQLVPR